MKQKRCFFKISSQDLKIDLENKSKYSSKFGNKNAM